MNKRENHICCRDKSLKSLKYLGDTYENRNHFTHNGLKAKILLCGKIKRYFRLVFDQSNMSNNYLVYLIGLN